MRLARARYITICQQLLALAAVLAVLAPASGIITLDLVPADPAGLTRPAESDCRTAQASTAFSDSSRRSHCPGSPDSR